VQLTAPPGSSGQLTLPATSTTRLPDVAIAAFETPTRNIACRVGDGGVRCDIHDHDWTPPPKPADCPLAWGDAVEVSSGSGAQFTCHRDTVFDASDPVLPTASAPGRARPCASANRPASPAPTPTATVSS